MAEQCCFKAAALMEVFVKSSQVYLNSTFKNNRICTKVLYRRFTGDVEVEEVN